MNCWTTGFGMLFILLQKVERGKQSNFFVERPELKGLINEQDEEGNTPMHLAAVEGYYKVLLKMALLNILGT